ncbi:selenocysteine insertion sequence-binding protein 2-like isoform X1 [Salarias fasciatus]|uniref:selenocysteine insertion sequence-binding protein 2-like isoform X1 n=1 Tax=Salarias fasciatus TaxID=181472 RepID=UPI0011766250|nr:selenocysteine insertion sequence-binding protein 2-like isoform X1 [Salarias fasciatus]
MDKESKRSPALDRTNQRRQKNGPTEPHTPSSTNLVLPNPHVSQQALRGSGSSPKLQGSRGFASRGRGYSNSLPVSGTSESLLQRDRSTGDPQGKNTKRNDSQGRTTGRNSVDSQRKGFRGARSAPSSAGKPKSAQTLSALFEVKMADFPELSGVSSSKTAPPVSQTDCWGPSPPSTDPKTPQLASSWKSHGRGSFPEPQQSATDVQSDASVVPPAQPVVASWANIASQPPKKPVLKDKTISNNHMELEDVSEQQEEGSARKKKRKKKKGKGTTEDVIVQAEEPRMPQEPPKFEDEEEFPGLAPASVRADRLLLSSSVKLCNEGNQREGDQHPSRDQNTEKPPTAKSQSTETTKKGQKAEKVSGKKSKVPVQLDIGNMLAALEKKQQSQKAKQDAKPLILSVGGGLPVVQKQQSGLKKPPWQQDKIAHNPLDSTSPLVKKGKQREVPKAKKPTPLKRVILKEREERKQRRLLEERGLLPEEESRPLHDATEEEEQCDTNDTDEVDGPREELDDETDLNDTSQIAEDGDEETGIEESEQQQVTSAESHTAHTPKIHSRKFRDYCSQMLSKDVDECVSTLLKELVRFQDRLYQKDPMKARMKRRIVMGLREVLKHLKLRKVKCVIISPNCERIQAKGGLDEALHTIIDTCREQDVPFVFALSRKALGRCVNKAVPVSLVGIFNYDGAQDFYHKMIELSSEARRAYELMVSGLEPSGQAETEQEANADEQQINTEELKPDQDCTLPEEPEYIKVWKKMLEKSCSHAILTFEEQLSSLHFNSECTENSEEDERS